MVVTPDADGNASLSSHAKRHCLANATELPSGTKRSDPCLFVTHQLKLRETVGQLGLPPRPRWCEVIPLMPLFALFCQSHTTLMGGGGGITLFPLPLFERLSQPLSALWFVG